MASDTNWLKKFKNLGGESNADKLVRALLIVPVAFLLSLANALEAIVSFFEVIPNTVIGGISEFIGSLFGIGSGTYGIAGILDAATQASATSISVFGVFSFPAGVLIILGAATLIAYYLENPNTSDFIPFSFTDFPLIGTQEEE